MDRTPRYFIAGCALTLPALFLAAISGGAGHGHYVFARACFPYSMLGTRLQDNHITVPLIVLALIQLPFYGLAVDIASRMRAKKWVIPSLIAAHATAALLCFSGLLPNFS